MSMAVCPIDGQPVISPQAGPGKAAASPQAVQPAFDVRLVLPFCPPENTGFLSNAAT